MFKYFMKLLGVGKNVSHHTPDMATFPQLDLDVIAIDCELDVQARIRGKKDLPKSDSVNFDNVENKVISIIENEKNESVTLLEKYLRLQIHDINDTGFTALIAKLESIPRDVINSLKGTIQNGKGVAWQYKKKYQELDEAMESFRIVNKLERNASYPDSKILQFGILALVFVIETALNGIFLSQGHDLGLLGGVGEAFVISFINIGLGFLVGSKLVPYLMHVEPKFRRRAFFFVILYIVIIFIFNLAVAHYRDILGNQLVDNPGNLALQKFAENPFNLDDIKSLWLLILGAMFSIIAVIDGFTIDDRYPGYGKLDKELINSQNDYIDYKEELLSDLNDTKDKGVSEIDSIVSGLSAKLMKLDSIKLRRETIEAAFNSHMNYLEESCNSLLTLYRTANLENRESEQPEYFEEQFSFSNIPNANEIISADKYGIDEGLRDEIDFQISESTKLKNKIYKSHEEMMLAYENLGDL